MRSNTASQPSSSTQPMQHQNQRYTNSYYPDKNESYDQFNNIQSKNFKRYHYQPYKKKTIAKNELITIHITNIAIIFTKPLFGLPKSTPTTKSNHFIFKDDSKNSKTYSRLKLKKYLITLHLKITH